MATHSETPEEQEYTLEDSHCIPAATTTEVVVARGRTLFQITAHHALLAGSDFYREYEQLNRRLAEQLDQFIQGNARTEPWAEPHEFLCEQLLPVFRRLSPDANPPLDGLTLQDLVATPMYTLEIVAGGPGSGQDIIVRGEEDGVTYSPSKGIWPCPTLNLRASCSGIPHIDASQVWIEPMISEGHGLRGMHFDGGKVRLADGTIRLFKASNKAKTVRERLEFNFAREFDILGQIKTRGLRSNEIRLPNLVGIVVSGDTTVGMLLELIPTSARGSSVIQKGCWEKPELCKKWERQVSRTVEVLHANNIVWGCAGPDKVVIDEKLDAWVTDFGGASLNRAFVDDRLKETRDGDWQGVHRIFREWLPTRRVDVHECRYPL